jgi:hypothetical protein
MIIEFDRDDRGAVLAHMRAVAARSRGWVNVQPMPVNEEDAESKTSLFSGPAPPKLPLCTWAIEQRRGRVEATIGVQHGFGDRVAPRLRERGVTAPEDWRVVQDHRRRGLVVSIPPDTDPEVALDWLVRAGEELAIAPTTGRWAAELFDG